MANYCEARSAHIIALMWWDAYASSKGHLALHSHPANLYCLHRQYRFLPQYLLCTEICRHGNAPYSGKEEEEEDPSFERLHLADQAWYQELLQTRGILAKKWWRQSDSPCVKELWMNKIATALSPMPCKWRVCAQNEKTHWLTASQDNYRTV